MDFYEILQVDRRAHHDIIRAAYRVLARMHHPDLGGNPRRMAAVNIAWATLSDPILRSRYDASLRPRVIPIAPATPMPAAAPAPRRAPAVPVMEEDAADASASTPPSMSAPPPPRDGTASGTVLDFGRYAGWTVGDLSRHDPDYLLWLERTPIGRPLRTEISEALEPRESAVATAVAARSRAVPAGRWFRRT